MMNLHFAMRRQMMLGAVVLTLGATAAFGAGLDSARDASLHTISVTAHRMVLHELAGASIPAYRTLGAISADLTGQGSGTPIQSNQRNGRGATVRGSRAAGARQGRSP